MGVFGRFFKPRPVGSERIDLEVVGKTSGLESRTLEPVDAPAPDPSIFLQPKTISPRGTGAVGLPPQPLLRPPEVKPTRGAEASDEITVTLGDILSRIPTQFLKAGRHDGSRELRFHIHDLSSDIARGRAAIPLSRIEAVCPDLFHGEITAAEDMEIRLPLQKVVEQIGRRGFSTGAMEGMETPHLPRNLRERVDDSAPKEKAEAELADPAAKLAIEEPIPEAAIPVDASPSVAEPIADLASKDAAAELTPQISSEAALPEQEPALADNVPAASPPGLAPPREFPPVGKAWAIHVQPPRTLRRIVLKPPPLFGVQNNQPREEPARPAAAPSSESATTLPLASSSADLFKTELEREVPVSSHFDEAAIQEIFLTDERLDLAKIAHLAAALPGIQGCRLMTASETAAAGELTPEFAVEHVRELSPRLVEAASRLAAGALRSFTLHGEQFCVTCFARPHAALCAIHRAPSFIPGVREKLAALADELSRNGPEPSAQSEREIT